jgi:hypothetical protein
MEPISPTDALFLIGESREHPMHVGSLQLFEPPEDAGPHFVRGAYQAMLPTRTRSAPTRTPSARCAVAAQRRLRPAARSEKMR